MLKSVAFFGVLLLASFGAFAHSHKSASDDIVKGRVIISPRSGLPAHHLKKFADETGGKLKKVGQSDIYILDGILHGSEKSVIARFSHNPHFKFAELDYKVTTDLLPTDPFYLSAWHLPKISAQDAWDISQGSGVTIAILDSGVDSNHPDLSSRLVPGWNFYDNNSNTADVYGHGTSVAGSAAAITNNAIGVSGVAGQAKVMPIRVTNTSGAGYTSMITSGLTYAADHGARVANLSFGGVAGSAAVQNAAQYMKNKGGLVVVAAGNAGVDEGYAPTSALIPISATDGNDIKASWSSFGKYVALAAPGVGIWTTTMGGGYNAVSGTSFASPITAGVVALMMAANSSMKNTDIENLLYSTATDIGDMGRDIYYGYGRVNAFAAVLATRVSIPTPDMQAPTVAIISPEDGTTVSGLVPIDVAASDNVGVARVELKVNGNTAAIDTVDPYAFTWDSTGVANGIANLVAYAFDAAGNFAGSAPVAVNVSNNVIVAPKDTTPPVVTIVNPTAGNVSGNVAISISATDNSGPSGITLSLYIDGALKATGKGSTMGYNWNTNPKNMVGKHDIQVIAKDAAGNTTSATVQVNVVK